MSKIISTTIVNPNGKEDTCALVQVNGQELYYLLRPIEVIGKYTISFWVKAEATENIVVHYGEQSKAFRITTDWQRVIFSFNAEHIDNVMIQFTTGNYYIYNTQLENGDVATDYNISPDDMEKQFADLETYVSKQYSEVVQSLNSYKVEVGKTYATKDSVNKDISKLTLDLNGFKTEVSKTYTTQTDFQTQIDNLQQQIDGAVETFSGSEVPTLTNKPAVDWTTDAIKDTHVGDLYVVSAENAEYGGFYYRFEKVNGVYQWTLLADSEVTKALEEARKANEKAEKAQKELDALKSNLETNYSTTVQVESAINQKADSILQTVSGTYATQESVTASLELKVGVDENDKVVSMLNASANEINLKSNRFSLESDYTSITKDGVFTTVSGHIGGWDITENGLERTDYLETYGYSVTVRLKPSTNPDDNVFEVINGSVSDAYIKADGGAKFYYVKTGDMQCSSIECSGTIHTKSDIWAEGGAIIGSTLSVGTSIKTPLLTYAGTLHIGTHNSTNMIINRVGNYQLRFNGTELYQCTSSASASNNCNLGSSSYRFNTLYANAADLYGSITVGGSASIKGGLELIHATPFIDFHYGNSTADYTSRIIESTSGTLTFYANIVPNASTSKNLGSNTLKWSNTHTYMLYYTSQAQTSDRRLKEDIKNIDNRYLELWDLINPQQFKFIGQDKTSLGIIAQELEEAMNKVGLTEKDCAFLNKQWVEEEKHYEYGVDYTFMNILNYAKLKQLQAEIEKLKA